MSQRNIIRAWKDEEYRSSLSDSERAMMPDHPAGTAELSEAQAKTVAGGYVTQQYSYCICTAPIACLPTRPAVCPRFTPDCPM